jgi:kinesin family protein C1
MGALEIRLPPCSKTSTSVMEVFADPSLPPVASPARKTRRLSARDENAAPSSAISDGGRPSAKKATPLNRFGFKKRPLPVVAIAAGTAQGEAVAHGMASGQPIDLVGLVDATLGDLDAAHAVLRMKVTGNQFDFKAKIADLQDQVKTLKATLSEQIKRGRRLGPEVLAPVQEEVNGRLRSLAETAATQRGLADRANEELASVHQRAEERGKRVQELREAGETMEQELRAHEMRADAEGRRADRAEGELRTRDEELAASRRDAEERRKANSAQEEAAAAAAVAANAEETRLSDLLAGVQKAFDDFRAESQTRETEIGAARDAETARAAAAEMGLAEAAAARDSLKESERSLREDHTALGELSAATRATLESVKAQLEEKTKDLAQKDSDLRDSIKTVTQMQIDNAAVIQHERQRAQGLEDEARLLRTRVQDAEAARTSVERDLEDKKQEADVAARELQGTQTALSHANTERERLAIETAEQKDSLVAKEEARSALDRSLSEVQEQLTSANATLATKVEELKALTLSKHELDVEFRSYQEHHGTSNQQQMAAISELKLTVDRLSQQYETTKVENTEAHGSLAAQASSMAMLEMKLKEQEAMRRALHNTIQELKGNIRVFCRVRPGSGASAVDTSQDTKLCVTHNADTHHFGFDKVFTPAATQSDVYVEVDGLVQSALDGYKVCIFAYGQTGSGKTHTMQGGVEPESWGLIPRALSKILACSKAMQAEGWSWTLHASFLEIYNEQLRDLLHTGGAAPSYAIKHDEAWGTVVANMGRVEVDSMAQINSLMAKAAKARAVGCTDMNSQSSRSHSVFALYLKGTNEKLKTELNGALHLVDLAGSERLSKSGAEGAALKETQAINKSLSSLAGVFTAKSSGAAHVPFRNSKLTHLMEPCLSGNGKTLMMVNVAPDAGNSHESLCSLRFAKLVNQCDTGGSQSRSKQPKRSEKPCVAGAPASKRPATAAASVKRPGK